MLEGNATLWAKGGSPWRRETLLVRTVRRSFLKEKKRGNCLRRRGSFPRPADQLLMPTKTMDPLQAGNETVSHDLVVYDFPSS